MLCVVFSCQEGKESEFDEHVDGILSEPFFCTLFRCDLVYDISFRAVFFQNLELRDGDRPKRRGQSGTRKRSRG